MTFSLQRPPCHQTNDIKALTNKISKLMLSKHAIQHQFDTPVRRTP